MIPQRDVESLMSEYGLDELLQAISIACFAEAKRMFDDGNNGTGRHGFRVEHYLEFQRRVGVLAQSAARAVKRAEQRGKTLRNECPIEEEEEAEEEYDVAY